jgi:predicted nucleic acid-binding Zn ribbon protein
VFLRITSQGDIEASGYTLGVLARERRRRRFIHILLYSLLALVILLILVRVYLSRMP